MPNPLSRLLNVFNLPRVRPMKEMGTSGTAIYGGYIRTVERSSKWIGQQKYRTIADIVANTSIVAASIHYFLNLLARPKWSVVPADEDSQEARELAEFVEEVINDMTSPWHTVVRRAGMYRFYGFGIQEWTAKKRKDGLIGLRDIETRPQHTIDQWVVDDSGTVIGVWQRSPQTGQLLGLPRQKIIYIVEDTLTDSPEGLGIFRHLADPYERLKKYIELEARGFERDLRGTPIGRAPLTSLNKAVADGLVSEKDAKRQRDALEDFIKLQSKESDTGMLLDSLPYESIAQDGTRISTIPQWDLQLLTGDVHGLADLNKAIERIQREMARIIGTEQLMLGETVGSRALSEDKSRNLYLMVNSVLRNITSVYDHDVINTIWTLNGFPEELTPWFSTEDVAFRDVIEVTEALRNMATAGAMLGPDDPVVNDVRDLLGVSRPFDINPLLTDEPDGDGSPSTSGVETDETITDELEESGDDL